MRIEIISIGSELLFDKVNTNVSYLAQELAKIGLSVTEQITVGDNPEEIRQVLSESLARADIIITTGGLGPTFDDYTREVAAKVLRKKLVFDREVMSAIARHFIDRNLEMPKENERQAYIITGAKVIPNKVGTAPGQIITVKRGKCKVKSEKSEKPSTFHLPPSTVVILLPGPPREMLPMLEENVIPYLKAKFGTGFTKSLTLHICGLPESEVDEKVSPILEQERKIEGLKFSLLAHPASIDLRITISGKDQILLEETLHKTKNAVYEILKENIYGENGQSLESVIAELLIRTRRTLAVAESCTGGLLGHRITNIPGSSLYFRQSVVAYSNSSKIQLLGVKSETIENYGAVSKETVLEMARGIRNQAKTDCVIAISGIAGPSGGTKEKPVGLVYIAVIVGDKEIIRDYHFLGNRLEIKEKAVTTALDLLRRELLKTV